MFKQRTLILIVVAGLLAIGAAFAANNWVLAKNTINEEILKKETPVVVATLELPYGQKIEEKHVNVILIPRDIVPSNAFSSTEEIIGKVAKAQHFPDEILRKERFADHLDGSTLAAMISKNMRAVTIRVNDVVGVAGFLLPGNRVDILATISNKTDTILKDIKVLAVDQTASTEKNEPVIVRAVTLEMTPSQTEILVQAREKGSIQLALRNPLDEELPEPKPKKVVKRTYKPSSTQYVTVIRGTSVTGVKTLKK